MDEPHNEEQPGPPGKKKRSLARFLFMSQRGWRIMGGVSIALAGLMAWYGSRTMLDPTDRGLGVLLYWLLFLFLLLLAIYAVLLDIRYIRVRFLLEEKMLYAKTMRKTPDSEEQQNNREKLLLK